MSESDPPENTPALADSDGPSLKTEISITENYWKGPLPSPEILQQYSPDTVRSVVSMAEKEQAHRHAFLDKEQKERSKARNFGFVTTLVSLVGGIYLISADKMSAIPYVLVIAAVGQLVVALIVTWLQHIRGKAKAGKP